MDPITQKLFSQRPDLREYADPTAFPYDHPCEVAEQVDEKDLSLSAWKYKRPKMKIDRKEILSDEQIRELFSPRPLTEESTEEKARKIGIVRAVKKNSFAGDDPAEAKDYLVDEREGLIGSQG